MNNPVVTMTTKRYWLTWAGVWVVTMITLYWIVRAAMLSALQNIGR